MPKITLDLTTEQIAQIQTQFKLEPEPEPAKPVIKYRKNGALLDRVEEDSRYFYIDDCGDISSDEDNGLPVDDYRFTIGNYFRTSETCKNRANKLKKACEIKLKLEQINAEHNWAADWSDDNQVKYCVSWLHPTKAKDADMWQTHHLATFTMCEQAKDYMLSDAVSDEEFINFIEVFSI